ncbi:CD44 antigen isoform X24 [Struthio camelus]|uniref:CD44 antigen isoform X24 n=1 Tax=Struthio camelus TaxID=8801 RepID=UPI003603FF8E
MASFPLWATFGLCLLKLCLTETVEFNVSCRYAGVFHVEKDGRYSLTRSEAVELCKALNSTLPTLEQMRRAHKLGFETCRYGFIVGHIVIPRINPYHLCAANHTGIYKLSSNTTGRYDAYCYNATETRDKTCEPIEKLDTSLLSDHSRIVIDNADGSRYNADGTRHSGDSSTSGVDDENVGSGSTHDTTAMDTSIRRSPSTSYFENTTPVLQLPDHSSGGGETEFPPISTDDDFHTASTYISLVPVADDFPEKGDGQQPASTTVTSPDGARHEDPTEPPLPSDNEHGQGTEGVTRATNTPRDEVLHGRNPASRNEPEDESPLTGTITESTDVVNHEEATKEPLAPSAQPGSESEQATTADGSHVNFIPAFFPDTEEDHLNRLHTPPPTTVTSPDGARHEDPTEPPLPSDNEHGQGTEGVTRATNTPRDEVLHGRNPASRNEPEDESPLTGTITESTDVVNHEEATKEPLAPSAQPGSESEQATTADGSHVNFIPAFFPDTEEDHLNRLHTPPPTTVTSPDGARHEDPTEPPLPSDNEHGQGTEGVTRATNTPRDEVLHGRNPASRNEPEDESPLTGTITESTDVVNHEEATKEPLAPSAQPGSESEQATTADGSHVNFIPAFFPDTEEDHLNRLHTPPPTTVTSPDGARHEDPTEPPLPSDNEHGQGTEGVTRATNTPRDEVLHGRNPASRNEPEDESPLTGTITESTDVVNHEEATKEPLAPSAQPGSESEQATTADGSHVNFIPAFFPDTEEDHLNRLHTPPPTRSTSSVYGNKGPHMGDYESTPFPGQTTTTINSQPRSAQVPEWLIIVAALVALGLILAVCIAVNSRRRCGQKKKLVINNGKGAVEDRKTGGLNGEASKSQEMVHLVHKEQSNDRTGACDEFLTIDETQNHQELDMKSGV